MRTITSPLYLARGLGLLLQPGIRRYVVIPLLINITLFALLTWQGFTYLSDQLDHYIATIPEWLQWIDWLLQPLLVIAVFAIGAFICLILANLIAAPFNTFLAEAILVRLIPATQLPDGGVISALKEIAPSLFNELKKLGYIALRATPLLILFIIPGLNIFAPVLWLIFSAWMLALEYIEYPMSTHGIPFGEARKRLGHNRVSTLGFGAGIAVLTTIPVVNFFIMPIAVAGACVFYVDQNIKNNYDNNKILNTK